MFFTRDGLKEVKKHQRMIYFSNREQIEKKAWKEFWHEESKRLLLYACRHGTVEVVDYFLKHRVSPTTKLAHNMLFLL